jgi:hypothetical protein
MAASASVTQSIDGATLTFTDTSTDISVTSRILTISDANNIVLSTIDMGDDTTATFKISKDVYLSFDLLLNGDTHYILYYISTQFYKNGQALLAAYSHYPTKCDGISQSSLTKAREAILAATTALSVQDGLKAQLMLDAADYYITHPTY